MQRISKLRLRLSAAKYQLDVNTKRHRCKALYIQLFYSNNNHVDVPK